jgi:hypothetical protein
MRKALRDTRVRSSAKPPLEFDAPSPNDRSWTRRYLREKPLECCLQFPGIGSSECVRVYAVFRDGAEIALDLLILRNEQNVTSERMRHSKLERDIGIEPGEIDHDMSGTAKLIPDGAQNVGSQDVVAADIAICEPQASCTSRLVLLAQVGPKAVT